MRVWKDAPTSGNSLGRGTPARKSGATRQEGLAWGPIMKDRECQVGEMVFTLGTGRAGE